MTNMDEICNGDVWLGTVVCDYCGGDRSGWGTRGGLLRFGGLGCGGCCGEGLQR